MGLSDFLFGKTSKLKPQQVQEPYQVEGRKKLYETAESGALKRLGRAGEPYPGQLTADLSKYETLGLDQLGRYLNSPMSTEGNLFSLGRAELEKTLTGEEYDPIEGEYYKAFRENLMRELQEAKDRLASRTSARDAFYSGGRVAGEAELEETAIGGMRQELGRLFEIERARRLGTVPEVMRMTAYEEMAPLARISASQEYGALPREWEQMGLDRDQAEWMRQLTDLGLPLDVALDLAKYKPEMYYPLYSSVPGFFGGPSGVGMQPGGGYGDAQKVKDTAGAIAQLLGNMKK